MDVKLGGLFSQLAYAPDDNSLKAQLPSGWVEVFRDGYPSQNGTDGAYVAYENSSSSHPELVLAFKGTNKGAEFFDDITGAGRTTIANVVGRARNELANGQLFPFSGYSITAVGHSLGGGAAQTIALWDGYDCYVYDSLPISSTVLQNLVVEAGPNASTESLLSDYRKSHLAVETYYGGEIAGIRYKTLTNGAYLDPQPTEVPSIANGLAARNPGRREFVGNLRCARGLSRRKGRCPSHEHSLRCDEGPVRKPYYARADCSRRASTAIRAGGFGGNRQYG